VEPESNKDLNIISGTDGVDKLITRDVDKERAEALIFINLCATQVNTILGVRGGRRVADYFFGSEAGAVASAFGSGAFPLDTFTALAAVDRGHSCTRCPAWPQKRHRLFVILVVLVFLVGEFTILTELFRQVGLFQLTLGGFPLGLLLLLAFSRRLVIHIGVGVARVLTLTSGIVQGRSGGLIVFGLGRQGRACLTSEL
jgi:uncharacterized integral membrane protein